MILIIRPCQPKYDGKVPFFISEYGGIRWTEDQSGWGYGEAPKTREEFGIYTYDRKPKFEAFEIYPIFAKKAAIED